jgi:TPR repeat protein
MKTRRFLVVVLLLFVSAAPVWGDDLAAFVDPLKTRAAQGEAKAQTILGILYDEGRGVPQDNAEALKWYRLAAAQGDALAQYHLGLMYAKGYGVPQNHIEAHKWFNLAAASSTSKPNRDRAVQACDKLAARMTPAQLAEAQKLAREWKKQ